MTRTGISNKNPTGTGISPKFQVGNGIGTPPSGPSYMTQNSIYNITSRCKRAYVNVSGNKEDISLYKKGTFGPLKKFGGGHVSPLEIIDILSIISMLPLFLRPWQEVKSL